MALQLYIGASGSGKSKRLYSEVINESIENPEGHYYIIVPDQFNMAAQKELVLSHPDRGILNIEVLSFGRLCHRIFEETGQGRLPVLDDTGKNLILRRLAARHRDELPFLGANIRKAGYIEEIKSSISEFMQYGIDVETLRDIAAYSKGRRLLATKLGDLTVLYEAFLKEIDGRFVTTEGLLGVLEQAIPNSSNMRGSLVVFDGFTGFTPIQLRVIGEILRLAKTVRVGVTMEPDSDDELFHLSRKMIRSLYKTADTYSAGILPELVIEDEVPFRFRQAPGLCLLEKNILRSKRAGGAGVKPEGISIFEARDPVEEVRLVGSLIKKFVRVKGCQYRDLAVVAGDLASYGEHIKDCFLELGIPFFMDMTKGVSLNPFIEYIKTALDVIDKDFSYDSVFAFLRCGFNSISKRNVDLMENHVLKYNRRGRSAYQRPFTIRGIKEGSKQDINLQNANRAREALVKILKPLMPEKDPKTAKDYTLLLYDFIVKAKAGSRLDEFEEKFKEAGDLQRASEYGRVYKLVMELLEKIYELVGDEEISLREYTELLEAGLVEISIGNIPQDVDRVSVGDMVRSRIGEVKALFFIGVNDGFIPKRETKGGLISDLDREFLSEGMYEMAPGPRERMIVQRLYLYMNLTKANRDLVLTYSAASSNGEARRPSYLIREIMRIFPDLKVQKKAKIPPVCEIEDPGEGARVLAGLLRDSALGVLCNTPGGEELLRDYYSAVSAYSARASDDRYKGLAERLKDTAFYRYVHKPLPRELVNALYGSLIKGSVSRLEKYSLCAYRYFLQYGLLLREREVAGFEAVDMGRVCHEILQRFSENIAGANQTLRSFDDETCEKYLNEAIDAEAEEYSDGILLSDERNRYMLKEIRRIMKRTAFGLRDQLKRGSFEPTGFEKDFHRILELTVPEMDGDAEERTDRAGAEKAPGDGTGVIPLMDLTGMIDRYDVAYPEGDNEKDGKKALVRILDYKTGDRKVDAAAVYYGMALQLSIYLGEAMDITVREGLADKAVAAGVFYYKIQDPMVQQEEKLSDEGIDERLKSLLRMEGIVSGDNSVLDSMDKQFTGRSSVIPVTRNKDGSLGKHSRVLSGEDMELLIDFARKKVSDLGGEILGGNIEKAPSSYKNSDGCSFCPYRGVCGFDVETPGYERRKLPEMDEAEALSKMRSELRKAEGDVALSDEGSDPAEGGGSSDGVSEAAASGKDKERE